MTKNYRINTGNDSAIVITKINRKAGKVTFINHQKQQFTVPLTNSLYQDIYYAEEGRLSTVIGFDKITFSYKKYSGLFGSKFVTEVEVIAQNGYYYKGEIHEHIKREV